MCRRALPWLCGGVATAAMLLSPGVAAARETHTCKGTPDKPGVLAGNYAGDVRVEGTCNVNAGPAHVRGTVTVRPEAFLNATFGLHDSRLTADGNLRVQRGATAVLGCNTTSSTCSDEPSMSSPTLSSSSRIGGNVTSQKPLGVVLHNDTIGGSVVHTGGGGGLTCDPAGVFARFGSPAYTDYEDSTVAGSIKISDVHSCWMGVIRLKVGGGVRLIDNRFADPDAIEILSNHIRGGLACFRNSMVWDSTEASQTGALYPRTPEPNTVEGKRLGQCELASPPTDSSPPGPGPF